MIKSFRDKDAEKTFYANASKAFPRDIQQRAYDKLQFLDVAASLNDLRIPPSNRLEKLSGDRKGQWSIRINTQWRICFEWKKGHAYGVEIVDYH